MPQTTQTVIYGSTEGFLTNNAEIDKRKHERRIAKWHVKGKDKTGKRFIGKTENVSQSGVLINVLEEEGKLLLNNKDKIYVEIEVVYKSIIRKIEGIAVIRHSSWATSGKRLGVEFIEIKELEKKFLKTYAVGKI